MKITLLGTGHGMVTNCYNTCFTLEENNEYFLVDSGGGNGIINQLEKVNINIENIKNMFISHTHTDHILGAIWILRYKISYYLKQNNNSNFSFNIFGNNDVISALKQVCNAVLPPKFTNIINNKINLIEVDTNYKTTILNKKIEFFDANANKVKLTGFSIYLNSNEKFTFIGDEYCKPSTEKYVKNSTWFFADAFMAGQEAEEYNPIKRHSHSTVKYVAQLCERLNIKNVILSHSIDTNLEQRKEIFINDAKKYYNGNVFAPYDLEQIDLL